LSALRADAARRPQRRLLLGLIVLLAVSGLFLFVTPIPQDPAYHQFADTRMLLGIPNAWNVLSNLPFLLVGGWGLVILRRTPLPAPALKPAYQLFFTGVLLTAFGSGYYHLGPTNDSLILDRLSMTIGFAGLFAIIVGEFVSVRIGRPMLWLLLMAGPGSVFYWAWTESQGAGDLRPYAIIQFLPMLLILLIVALYRSAHLRAGYVWAMILFYMVAKVTELLDAEILAATSVISGHTLKHILAALTPAILVIALGGAGHAGLHASSTRHPD
jgi:hypothetical protein